MARARAEYEITAKDKTARAFSSVKRRFRDAAGAARSFAGQIAGLAGIGGFGALVKSALDAGDEIQKLNIQLGASTEFLSEMRFVTERSGVSFKAFTTAIRTMQKSINDLSRASKTQVDAFAAINVRLSDLQGLSPDEQFLKIGEALSKVEDASLRSAVAQQIFGGRSSEVLRLFEGGIDTIDQFRQTAREMGRSLSREQVDQMAAANDAITDLKNAFAGLIEQLAVKFAPSITAGVQAIQTVAIPVLEFFGALVRKIGTAIGFTAAAWVTLFTEGPTAAFRLFQAGVGDFFGQFGGGAPPTPAPAPGPTAQPGLSGRQLSGEFRAGQFDAARLETIQQDGNQILQEIAELLRRNNPNVPVAG